MSLMRPTPKIARGPRPYVLRKCPDCSVPVVYKGGGKIPCCTECLKRRRSMSRAAFREARRLRKLPRIHVEQVALGANAGGLGCPCACCLPALVVAHVYRDGLPCCHKHAESACKPRVPSFVLKHLRAA